MTADENGAARVAALNAALAAAQGEFPPIEKGRTATVETRSGGSYQYRYVDLGDVLAAVRPVLAKHGLAFVQLADDGYLVTQLRHSEGGVLSARWPLRAVDSDQALGSHLTYLRRYAACAMLGIAAEDDDDGRSARATPTPTPESRRADAPKWTQRTRGAIFAALDGLQQRYPPPDDAENWEAVARAWVRTQYGYESLSQLLEPQAQALLRAIHDRRDQLEADRIAEESFDADAPPADDDDWTSRGRTAE